MRRGLQVSNSGGVRLDPLDLRSSVPVLEPEILDLLLADRSLLLCVATLQFGQAVAGGFEAVSFAPFCFGRLLHALVSCADRFLCSRQFPISLVQVVTKTLNAVSFAFCLGDFGTGGVSRLLSIPGHVDAPVTSTRVVELAAGFVEFVAESLDPCSGIVTLANAAANLGAPLVGGLALVSKVDPWRPSPPAPLPSTRERLVHALLGAGDDAAEHRVLGECLQRGGELSFPRLVGVIVETQVEHGGDFTLIGQQGGRQERLGEPLLAPFAAWRLQAPAQQLSNPAVYLAPLGLLGESPAITRELQVARSIHPFAEGLAHAPDALWLGLERQCHPWRLIGMPILEFAGGRCAVQQQQAGTHGVHERRLADLVRPVQDVETVLE